jgi:gentisate 1,2-dioxygenase
MKIIRVFSGDDGESHFEEITPEEMAGIVNRVGPGDITLGLRPSPSFSDYHNAPRRQYVVNLSGTAEFECADGSKVQMEPGDILVAEDLEGHGHIARSLGDTPRASLAVPLAEPN